MAGGGGGGKLDVQGGEDVATRAQGEGREGREVVRWAVGGGGGGGCDGGALDELAEGGGDGVLLLRH